MLSKYFERDQLRFDTEREATIKNESWGYTLITTPLLYHYHYLQCTELLFKLKTMHVAVIMLPYISRNRNHGKLF